MPRAGTTSVAARIPTTPPAPRVVTIGVTRRASGELPPINLAALSDELTSVR